MRKIIIYTLLLFSILSGCKSSEEIKNDNLKALYFDVGRNCFHFNYIEKLEEPILVYAKITINPRELKVINYINNNENSYSPFLIDFEKTINCLDLTIFRENNIDLLLVFYRHDGVRNFKIKKEKLNDIVQKFRALNNIPDNAVYLPIESGTRVR